MGFMTQLNFLCVFVLSEIYVLTSMAYDCYVAICNPLLYNAAMSPKVCSSLVLGSYLMAFSGAMAHAGNMLTLTFCDANIICHFFLWHAPSCQLSCTITISISWYFSVWWASISLCPVSPSLHLMVSSSAAFSISSPWKEDPKPSAPVVPTELLFPGSLDQVHLCILNHLLLGPRMRGKSLLSLIPTLFSCYTP